MNAPAITTLPLINVVDISDHFDLFELKEAALQSDSCEGCMYATCAPQTPDEPQQLECIAEDWECPTVASAIVIAQGIIDPISVQDRVNTQNFLIHIFHPDYDEYQWEEKVNTVFASNAANLKIDSSGLNLPLHFITPQLEAFLIKGISENKIKRI